MIPHSPVVIIGAGFGGLAQAAYLKQAGIDDLLIFERADEVGGTWRDNTYPGCACDVPSDLYSLSFAPNPHWTRHYGSQAEIFAYLRGVADRLELRRHIRFGHELRSAQWDEARRLWQLQTSAGAYTAKVLVTATGPFGAAQLPSLPGRETFAGPSFHSLHWAPSLTVEGRRVGLIGTGASAIQIGPAIASQVRHLAVFQRTPTWIMPRFDAARGPLLQSLLAKVPFVQRCLRGSAYALFECIAGLPQFGHPVFLRAVEWMSRRHLHRQVKDPALRAALTPKFRFACKRPVLSDTWYPTLCRRNVELVTAGIARIEPNGVRTDDGRLHELDVLIFATGFRVPHEISERIADARGRTLAGYYRERPQSYMGACADGFPNLFTLLGPFSAAGNQSAVYMLEAQARYVARVIRSMREEGADRLEVEPQAVARFSDEMHRLSSRTTWVSGGCTSYYQSDDGANRGLWPSWSFAYKWRTRRFRREHFTLRAAERGA